jgi:hypothetical protein
MRIANKADEPEEEIPLEVQLWLSRGWTVIPSERRGIVLSGPKEMKGRTKFVIFLGVLLVALVFFSFRGSWPWLGVAFIAVAVLDYKFATKPPTKFFPADGEKKRSMERG